MLESLFNKVVCLETCNFIKNRHQHRCFPVNFEKFLRTSFEQNTSLQLLLLFFQSHNSFALHKKWSFPLRISSVNVTFTEEILNWKFQFLCSVGFYKHTMTLSLTHFRPLFYIYTSWKVSVFGVFLVLVFPHSDWIRRETVSLRIQSKCGKIQTRKTSNTDTFHVMIYLLKTSEIGLKWAKQCKIVKIHVVFWSPSFVRGIFRALSRICDRDFSRK